MKIRNLLVLFSTLLFSMKIWSLSPSCEKLKEALDSPMRIKRVIDILEEKCKIDPLNSPRSIILAKLQNAYIEDTLRKSQSQRMQERQSLIQNVVGKMVPLKDLRGLDFQKMNWSIFDDIINGLNRKKASLGTLKSDSLQTYFDSEFVQLLSDGRNLKEENSSVEFREYIKVVDEKITEFARRSDAVASKLDKQIGDLLDKSISKVELLKSAAKYRMSVEARSEILSGVNETVMKLLADNAWSMFVLKNKIDLTLSYAQLKSAGGMVNRARVALALVETQIETFEKHLDPRIKKMIQENQAKTYLFKIATFKNKLSELSDKQIEDRLTKVISYFQKQLEQKKANCIIALPSQEKNIDQILMDAKGLKQVVQKTEDHDVIKFSMNAMAERMEIMVDACKKVSK